MTVLFNRQYKFLFGQPNAQGKLITQLHITFDIEKTDKSEPNQATITVYNLNSESRAELSKPDTQVYLEAGYGDDTGIIFQGNNLRLTEMKNGTDIIVELRTGDGEKQIQETMVNASFPAGSLVKDAITRIVDLFPNIAGKSSELSGLPLTKLATNLIASEPAKAMLDKLLGSIGFDWSIQDGEFRTVKKELPSQDATVIVSPKSGLLQSPVKTEKGIQFVSFLNARFRPMRSVTLKDTKLDGTYKIIKVNHRGDNETGDWLSMVEAVSEVTA